MGGEGKCLGFAELAEYCINSVKRCVYLYVTISTVVLGSRIRMMTAVKHNVMANERSPTFTWNRKRIPTLGLYSAFHA
jgi:hypothetical protein